MDQWSSRQTSDTYFKGSWNMSDWFHGEYKDKKLPLSIIRKMAEFTKEYLLIEHAQRIDRLWLAGSHSPLSNHTPEGESDIDFYVFYPLLPFGNRESTYRRLLNLSLQEHPYLKLVTGMEINVTFVPDWYFEQITTAFLIWEEAPCE